MSARPFPQRDVPRMIGLFRAGRLPVDQLLTHRLKLEEIEKRRSTVKSAPETGFRRTAAPEGPQGERFSDLSP